MFIPETRVLIPSSPGLGGCGEEGRGGGVGGLGVCESATPHYAAS